MNKIILVLISIVVSQACFAQDFSDINCRITGLDLNGKTIGSAYYIRSDLSICISLAEGLLADPKDPVASSKAGTRYLNEDGTNASRKAEFEFYKGNFTYSGKIEWGKKMIYNPNP